MQKSITPIVSTVAELESIYSEYCNGPRTDLAKSVPNVRFAKLEPNDKSILSEYTANNVYRCLVDFNVDGMADFVLGLIESDGSLPLFATYDGKSYSAKRNTHNRKKTDSRIGPATKDETYSNMMVRGHWITNENDPGLIDWFGFVRSFQHRLDAIKRSLSMVRESGGKLPLFPMVFGIPPQFADMTDKAKSRTAKDDDFCDTEQFPYDLIRDVQTELCGEPMESNDLVAVRTKCIELRQKVLGTLRQRLRGSDISKTGDKLTDTQKNELIERLGGSEIVDKFIVTIFESQRSQSGKLDRQWSELFSPAIVATGLILASNSEDRLKKRISENIVRNPDESPEQYAERCLHYKQQLLDGPIQIDSELIDLVLEMLRTSTSDSGPLATVFGSLFDKKRNDKKAQSVKSHLFEPLSLASMSAFVQLVKNIESNDIESSVWTVYRNISDDSNVVKYSPEYRCFGGMDVGYTKRSATKKSKD